MAEFKIGNRLVGDKHPAFIIAEIGNNHNGDFAMAKRLIDEAIEAKADAVKFQLKDVETAFAKDLLDSPYVNENSFGKTYREHKQALEFSMEQYAELKNYSEKKGATFFATPFEVVSTENLIKMNVPAFKIASFHVTQKALIEKICSAKKPIIVSTGMSSLDEIDNAVAVLKAHNAEFAILQCTSSYPTSDKDVNLAVIPELKKRYGCVVGYSGHERGISIAAASVCFGAKIIEKHFTLDRTLKGPDHALSLEPKGFAQLVERVRILENAIGSPEKRVLECELGTRKKNRGY